MRYACVEQIFHICTLDLDMWILIVQTSMILHMNILECFPMTMFRCPLCIDSDSPLSTLDQQAGAEQLEHAAITEDCIVFIHFKLQYNFMCVMFISDVLENWNAGLAHPQSQQ